MSRILRAVFGAHGQVVAGVVSVTISVGFWTIGCLVIPGVVSWPWHWDGTAFIFHASMFALIETGMGYIASGLGYRATERVEAAVVENIESAETVEINGQ